MREGEEEWERIGWGQGGDRKGSILLDQRN